MSTLLKTLLAIAATIIFQIKSSANAVLRSISPVPRRRLIRSSSSDPEAAAVAVFTVVSNKNPEVVVDWRQVTVTFCFCGGVALSIVPAQVLRESPISFRVLPVLIALTISFLFMSDVILAKHPSTARVLKFIWKLSVGAALFTALCIPLPTTLKCVVWTIFAGTAAGVFIMNFISSSSP
uniref:Uncharacterized protein n=1 Tax=Kalanchoe fedtschenkoi TaxID=63787 RepID=A0A7N0TTX4_KALFE